MVSAELHDIGLDLKPSKTRITHTLIDVNDKAGFDFLGFHIRQYPAGKTKSGKDCQGRLHGFKTLIKPSPTAIQRHIDKLRKTIASHRHSEQAVLIKALSPKINGWSQYYAHVASARVFQRLDNTVYQMLQSWAVYHHPNKPKHWIARKYWRVDEGQGWVFRPTNSDKRLARHDHTPIQRHVKIQGQRSPYDGDWLYWSRRLGRHPDIPARVAILLKRQQGKCNECGLYFLDDDQLEVDHIVPKWIKGNDALVNLQLLHRHCHDRKTARETGSRGADDKRRVVEEPDEGKPSRPVLKPSQEGRPSWLR